MDLSTGQIVSPGKTTGDKTKRSFPAVQNCLGGLSELLWLLGKGKRLCLEMMHKFHVGREDPWPHPARFPSGIAGYCRGLNSAAVIRRLPLTSRLSGFFTSQFDAFYSFFLLKCDFLGEQDNFFSTLLFCWILGVGFCRRTRLYSNRNPELGAGGG